MKADWFRSFSILVLKLSTTITQALEICMTQLLWFPPSTQFSQILDQLGFEHGLVDDLYRRQIQRSVYVRSKNGTLIELEQRTNYAFFVNIASMPISRRIVFMELSNRVVFPNFRYRHSKPIDRFTFALSILDLLHEPDYNDANWLSRFPVN